MREIKFRAWDNNHEAMHYSEDCGIDQLFDWVERHGGVVMQYTGLTDKNGKEGFDCDLVMMFDRSIYKITWDDDYAGYKLKLYKGKELMKSLNMLQLRYGEIIGNIHENPELL